MVKNRKWKQEVNTRLKKSQLHIMEIPNSKKQWSPMIISNPSNLDKTIHKATRHRKTHVLNPKENHKKTIQEIKTMLNRIRSKKIQETNRTTMKQVMSKMEIHEIHFKMLTYKVRLFVTILI